MITLLNKFRKIHYGWVICVLCLMLLFSTMGVGSNGFSVFLPFILDGYGLTHAQTSSLITIRCFVAFFSMLCIGKYYDKMTLRFGTALACAVVGVAYMVCSFSRDYIGFCIGSALLGISYGLGSMIPVSILLGKWFMKRRGFAIGLAASGSGISTIVLPPISTLLITKYSLPRAFAIEGAFVFILAVTLCIFMRNNPADKNLKPFGYKEMITETLSSKQNNELKERTMTKRNWMVLCCISMVMGATANPGFNHLTVLYTTEGFSAAEVAAIMSLAGIIITAWKIGFGQVADVIGGRKTSMLFGLILTAGHILCCLSFMHNTVITFINILVIATGYPIATIGIAIWAGDFAPSIKYADTVRRLQIAYAGGALLFASMPGIIADIFGTYIPAYMIFSAVLILIIVMLDYEYRNISKAK